MGGSPSIIKGSPLEEILCNWSKIEGVVGLKKKRVITLCQDDWPFLTRVRGAGPDEVWPPEGTFDDKRLATMRRILQDRNPYQMDYLYVWINWADKRNQIKLGKATSKTELLAYFDELHQGGYNSDREKDGNNKEVGQYPMTIEFHSNPRVGPDTGPDVPPLLAAAVHQPWKPGDLMLWQEKMPRLREDAEKCAKMLSSIFRDYKPNWEDIQTLLQELFTVEEREKIMAKDRELSNTNPGRPVWPIADPKWNIVRQDELQAWRTATQGLLEAVRQCVERVTNWSKVQECQQRLDEHPSDYWHRLRSVLLKYGGMTEQTFQEPLAISVFVNQAAPDINKYFKKHMPGWQAEGLQKILSVATFVYNGRDQERQEKMQKEKDEERKRQERERETERKRERQEKREDMAFLAAAITQSAQQNRWQNARGRGRGNRGRRRGFPPQIGGEIVCYWCGDFGHMQRECPLRPRPFLTPQGYPVTDASGPHIDSGVGGLRRTHSQ